MLKLARPLDFKIKPLLSIRVQQVRCAATVIEKYAPPLVAKRTEPSKIIDPQEGHGNKTKLSKSALNDFKYPKYDMDQPRISPPSEEITSSTNISDEVLVRSRKAKLYKPPMQPHSPVLRDASDSLNRGGRLRLNFQLPDIVPMKRNKLQLDNGEVIYFSQARGARKTAVALASIKPGTGLFTVNGKTMQEYFPRLGHREIILEPFLITRTLLEFDVAARVMGGGMSGQAGALQLAVARSIQNWEPQNRGVLKSARLLTRDPRMVERKKYGQKKARKKFQWVKR